MKQATVGVIGHVNHGKTALVKALTGTDTDRLAEEKRRGMSIVLGFAWLALDEGGIDLIDVPGHEQFIRTMVSGAAGIDATLLVVNAREGVKPQTVEHVGIAELLGVRRGIVAITKADLVDEPRRGAVTRELRALLRGTHLEFSPVVFTSVPTGEGLQPLREELARLLAGTPAAQTSRSAHPWLPIDRVFTLAGHGTVVTGTLRGGTLRAGDPVACLPRGLAGTVRQLQVHNEPAELALPGQRVGVNLRHIRADEVARGDVLAPPARLRASTLLDVALRLLPPAKLDHLNGQRVRLLIGTSEVAAVVRVLAPKAAGGALAQLRCARPVVAVAGERFVLRRESPAATLGGGQVLDPAPARHGVADRAAVQRLVLLAGGSADQRLLERLRRAGADGVPGATLAAESGFTATQLASALEGIAVVHEQRVWSAALIEEFQQRVLDALARWHGEHPLRAAAPLTVPRRALPPGTGEALGRLVLTRLEREQRIVRRDGQVRLAGHDPLAALDAAARERLLDLSAMLRDGGMNPPDAPPPEDSRRSLLELLVDLGEVLLLPGQPPSQRIAFHREAVAAAHGRLAGAFPPPNSFTVSQARELLGSTRKFTVPLLQHLHATGRTRRIGDQHMFLQHQPPGGE